MMTNTTDDNPKETNNDQTTSTRDESQQSDLLSIDMPLESNRTGSEEDHPIVVDASVNMQSE